MNTMRQSVVILGLSFMLFAATAAFGDTVTIKLFNDDADEIVATVVDMNADPPGVAIANQRISGFAWIPILVNADDAGYAHVRWTARTADASFRRCGHQEKRGVANDGSVRVYVNSRCGRSAR
jgi:hypothetical protein